MATWICGFFGWKVVPFNFASDTVSPAEALGFAPVDVCLQRCHTAYTVLQLAYTL